MQPLPIIIDCDPGQDDVINILLALGSPQSVRVLGITTVAGNVTLDKTQRNARLTCDLAGATDTAVYAGCDRPLMRALHTAEAVHGESGIDGLEVHEPAVTLQSEHGVDYLIRTLLDSGPGEITLVATGPLTNIAMALRQAPRIADRIAEIVVMGGAMREGGNITPSAEFNMAVDPHAAHIVMHSGIAITMFGLDVTHQFQITRAHRERVRAADGPVSAAIYRMLCCAVRHDESKYARDGAPLHDPCTLLYLLDASLFEFRDCALDVETESSLTYGHTAVDFWRVTGQRPNVRWACAVDGQRAFERLLTPIRALDAARSGA